ncbi:coiled-coil domain-containing protein 138-like isoform X2 [Brienomyrus brachyistius]|uniref:coiled-coil domain-containing protein 138-like isoform X2 n=1 Tax=Brienomyrus brachyistius TaxID=42636 RepID=UPI0020B34283|nr:coiled-coil domain-containing protein 138-like isoform X2 [Brienomyrus brachyistius]
MSSLSSDVDIDTVVEKLKKKYLERVDWETAEDAPEKNCAPEEFPFYDLPRKRYSPCAEEYIPPVFEETTDCKKPVREFFKVVPNNRDLKDDLELHRAESEYEDSGEESPSVLDSHSYFYTETDVTLPSNLARISSSCVMKAAAPSGGRAWKVRSSQMTSTSPNISQVYQEMLEIYEKLQAERVHQQRWAARLQQKESVMLRHCDALCEVEQYQQKIKELKEALEEKTKESKRMKSSLEAVKGMNEALKKQLSDVCEKSKKMETQSRKVQARLENLQRKYEYSLAQKGRENITPKSQGAKPPTQDCSSIAGKLPKGSRHPGIFRLLVQTLDWVTDILLAPPGASQLKTVLGQQEVTPGSLPERCSKVLPLLAEQLLTLPVDDAALHMSLLRFIYWSLRQLDGTPQQSTLTSTFRRLGEEVYRGPALRGISLDLDAPQRTKSPFFYKSPSLHTRFLSTLVLLKTATQADILAQALGTLHEDVRHDDGRALFLLYRALPVISSHLKAGSRALLSLALDVLQQMSVESGHLNCFLESCSTEDFFRSVSLLLRSPRLEVPVVEKVSILLQKLSKMRKNRRLFELFTIHLTLQEMQRTADPTHSFLVINLSSILFNLGMLKKARVCDGAGAVG